MLKCTSSTRKLEVIPFTISSSARLLKAYMGTARIYIRPIQVNLDLTPMDTTNDCTVDVKQECLQCGENISITQLRDHVKNCQRQFSLPDDSSEDSAEENSNLDSPIIIDSEVDTEDTNGGNGVNDGLATNEPKGPLSRSEQDTDGSDREEDNVAVNEPEAPHVSSEQDPSTITDNQQIEEDIPIHSIPQRNLPEPTSQMADYIHQLMSVTTEEAFILRIRRGHILEDTLVAVNRAAFSPYKTIKVKFLGEDAIDEGGPKREFWRLLALDIKSQLCIGSEDKLTLDHDVLGLQSNKYYKLGELMAMSIAQQGSGFPFFSLTTYHYLANKDTSKLKVILEDIPNPEVRRFLTELQEEEELAAFRNLLASHFDILCDCGYRKPTGAATLQEDKNKIIRTVFLHQTIYSCLAELDQLKEGLNVLGVTDEIAKSPDLLVGFFTSVNTKRLTADFVEELFKPRFSEASRTVEEAVYMQFSRLLNEAEDNTNEEDITLTDILVFFSGAVSPPPLGFPMQPALEFSATNIYPTASTCALVLTLPMKYNSNYAEFKRAMFIGLKYHGGFGNV